MLKILCYFMLWGLFNVNKVWFEWKWVGLWEGSRYNSDFIFYSRKCLCIINLRDWSYIFIFCGLYYLILKDRVCLINNI